MGTENCPDNFDVWTAIPIYVMIARDDRFKLEERQRLKELIMRNSDYTSEDLADFVQNGIPIDRQAEMINNSHSINE